jgi:hypothetical protein
VNGSPGCPPARPPCDRCVVKPTQYRIVVSGELGSRYAARFAPMQLSSRDGETEIVGRIEDDAELQGVLDTVAALGLSLVSVAPVTPEDLGTQSVDGRDEATEPSHFTS